MISVLLFLTTMAGVAAQLKCPGQDLCGPNLSVNGAESVIVAGEENQIGDVTTDTDRSGILAGFQNTISDDSRSSGILAGEENQIKTDAKLAAVVAGKNNRVRASRSIVGAGKANVVRGVSSGILAGEDNKLVIGANNSGILAGNDNTIGTDNDGSLQDSGIVAGQLNSISVAGARSIIGAGKKNEVKGADSAVLSGKKNIVEGLRGAVVTGDSNEIVLNSENSAILGGKSNVVGTSNSGVMVGESNTVQAKNSLIGGGSDNHIPGNGEPDVEYNAFIAAGRHNEAAGINSAVIGSNGVAGADGAIVISAYSGDDTFKCLNNDLDSVKICGSGPEGVQVEGGLTVDGVNILAVLEELKAEVAKLKGKKHQAQVYQPQTQRRGPPVYAAARPARQYSNAYRAAGNSAGQYPVRPSSGSARPSQGY